MLKITTPMMVYGPYNSVRKLADRFIADGAELPFSVIGDGNVGDWTGPLPAPDAGPVPVPQWVTMRQARLALLAAGKLAQVAAAIAQLPSPHMEVAMIEWEYSPSVRRTSPLVLALMPAIGLDDAAMDALFIAAAKI